jgi:hypothetical protein
VRFIGIVASDTHDDTVRQDLFDVQMCLAEERPST